VEFAENFLMDGFVATGAAVLLWMFVFINKKLDRWEGFLMLLAYAIYFAWLCM
jgi:Ca2+/Na+ antiporter